jgi:fibronectin-binding autotransporter adhesin
MKTFLIASATLCVASVPAADVLKLGSGTDLNAALNWTGGVAPGSSDVATWDGTSLAAGLTLGTNVSWQGIRISGSSGSATVSITGAGTLNLGGSGINLDESAVSATFSNAVSLASNQTWSVNAGRTLTLSGQLSGSGNVAIGSAPSRSSALFLTSSLQTIASGMTLTDVTGISGLMAGNFVNSQRPVAAHGYLVSSSATSQVYWLQTIDGGFNKAVKVELVQSGADIQARVLASKFQSSGSLGFNFETGGSAGALAGAYNSDGYGAYSLGLHTGSAPVNQGGSVTISGTNASYAGNMVVHRGRLVLGTGSAFNGGNSPSRGTGTLTVGPGGVVASSTGHAIWGGQTNTRSLILDGGVVDIAGGQEYFHTLQMTAGLVTRGNGGSANLFRVGSATGAGQITTNASNASAIIATAVDMTLNSLTLNVADGAAVDDLVIAGAISENTGAGSGAKTLTKSGSGTVFLQAASSFTGGVTVNAGTIRIGNQSALGAKSTAVGAVTVASGGTVDINGVLDATYGYTLSGSGVGGLGALVNNGGTIGTGIAQTTNLRLAANATIGGSGEWGMLASAFGAT